MEETAREDLRTSARARTHRLLRRRLRPRHGARTCAEGFRCGDGCAAGGRAEDFSAHLRSRREIRRDRGRRKRNKFRSRDFSLGRCLYRRTTAESRVHFSSPEEDAKRRDFTINGMFLDPAKNEVIDFVGGRADLEAQAGAGNWRSGAKICRRSFAHVAGGALCHRARL